MPLPWTPILNIVFVFSVFAFVLTNSAAQAQTGPSYTLDSQQTRVLRMFNLAPARDCFPAEIDGRIVKQEFDPRGIVVKGATIQQSHGERTYVNVELDINALDRASAGWIVQGLQTMLRQGSRVRLGVILCGAAGRVVVLDSVQLR